MLAILKVCCMDWIESFWGVDVICTHLVFRSSQTYKSKHTSRHRFAGIGHSRGCPLFLYRVLVSHVEYTDEAKIGTTSATPCSQRWEHTVNALRALAQPLHRIGPQRNTAATGTAVLALRRRCVVLQTVANDTTTSNTDSPVAETQIEPHEPCLVSPPHSPRPLADAGKATERSNTLTSVASFPAIRLRSSWTVHMQHVWSRERSRSWRCTRS